MCSLLPRILIRTPYSFLNNLIFRLSVSCCFKCDTGLQDVRRYSFVVEIVLAPMVILSGPATRQAHSRNSVTRISGANWSSATVFLLAAGEPCCGCMGPTCSGACSPFQLQGLNVKWKRGLDELNNSMICVNTPKFLGPGRIVLIERTPSLSLRALLGRILCD